MLDSHTLSGAGMILDPERNALGEGRISAEASPVPVWVIPTDEERLIARHTLDAIDSDFV
jgi:acetate kinase